MVKGWGEGDGRRGLGVMDVFVVVALRRRVEALYGDLREREEDDDYDKMRDEEGRGTNE